ncbi:purine-binding chemotaxis protein CheW, partial [Candidatus Dependentiae bacterium]|nr:purine-binding chemotaxis protein CheW [Candidatus Dependentiae bacterium]
SKEIKALHEEIHQSDSRGMGDDTLPINKEDTQEIGVEVSGSSEEKSVELSEPEKSPVTKPKTIPLSSIFKIIKGGENQAKVEEEIVEETPEQIEDEDIIEETIEGVVESDQELKEQDHEDLESDQIIAFYLGSEQYGMEILDAREVKRILPLTPIPRTPDWILGVVNLRGIVFPVVDLKKRLKIEANVNYPPNLRRIIVIEIGETRIGLLVDKINMILNKQLLEYSVPPVLISGGEDFISSIAKKDDMIISIISLSRLFTSEERELLAQIKEEKT